MENVQKNNHLITTIVRGFTAVSTSISLLALGLFCLAVASIQ